MVGPRLPWGYFVTQVLSGGPFLPIILENQPFESFRGAIPLAVELLPGSENLLAFDHPENVIYVFGPEDGTVPRSVRMLCHRRVFIPTKHCTNLGAAIYLVLYDRLIKRYLNDLEESLPLGDVLAESRGWPLNDPMFEKSG